MTSRARRIVLAMYGHRAYTPVIVSTTPTDVPPYYTAHCCYEAMDDLDSPKGLVGLYEAIQPRRVLVGGNYGLPCA